jgi:2-methylcitrate dehydratase PrpD
MLAERIDGFDLATLPPEVRERARTCLLYTLAMTVAGQADDATARATRSAFDAGGPARVLVHGDRRSAAAAAYVNGALASSRGQNDTHPGSVAHAGCIVVPAVLALAQARGIGGARVLEALVAGYEMLPTIAQDVAGEVVARGARATAVFGPIVSAAACARLIGLDVERTAHALSIATQYSGGTMQCWAEGTPEWRVQVGRSASGGIECALLAENGMVGASEAFEGASGFYRTVCGRVPVLTDHAWHLGEMVFKPYPGCLINQAPVHLVLEILRSNGLTASDVDAVEVAMAERDARYPGVDQYGPFEQPTGAVMSLAFMVEVALRDGGLTKAHFDRSYGPDPVHAASRRVRLVVEPERAPWSFGIRVLTRDGRVFTASMPDQQGFAFGWSETVRMLGPLCEEWSLPDAAARFASLVEAVSTIERAPDVNAIVDPCIPAA